jgi:hypothetical protein
MKVGPETVGAADFVVQPEVVVGDHQRALCLARLRENR